MPAPGRAGWALGLSHGAPTPTAIPSQVGKASRASREFLSEAHWKIDALYFPLAK